MSDALYFGRWGAPGHVLFAPGGRPARERDVLPRALHNLDSPYPPQCTEGRPYCRNPERCQPQGVARVHHVEGWTVLAFWDRSGDPRHGSHSTFVLRGTLDFAAAVALARAAFPAIWARYRFDVRPEASSTPANALAAPPTD